MKKLISSLLLVSAIGLQCFSQDKSRINFSVGPEIGFVVGINSAFYGAAVGGTAELEIPVSGRFVIAPMTGVTYYLGKTFYDYTFTDLRVIPLKAGLKYFLKNSMYGIAQAGAGFFNEGANTKFGYGFGLGYFLHLKNGSGLDLSGRADAYTGNGGSISSVGARLAYRFR